MVTIRGYEDLQPIGRGGFGVVYRGRDRRFARDVAVKVLSGVLDDTMTARFERECHAVGALSGHPHIVVVHDSGTTDDGLAYLVMELLSGGSLADRLAVTGPQGWPQAAELGMQLAGALETAHLGGVLHRDVKPENVLLSAYRQPKLVDFGIATVRGGFETKSASISASLAHAAPEILAGKRSSTESDVYALGSTLFQVLAGQPAFINPDDETLFPLLTRISSQPVPDLRPRGVPHEIAAVIERSMAKVPDDRYPSALAFAQDLQVAALANGQVLSNAVVMGDEQSAPIAAPSAPTSAAAAPTTQQAAITPALPVAVSPDPPAPARPEPSRRSRRGLALAAAALVLVAGGGGYALLQGDSGTPGPAAVTFVSAADASVSTTRTWSLDETGVVLSSDTVLTNPSNAAVTRTAIEVIPKSVASDARAVTFEPAAVVVDPDPVVRWQVMLAPGQVVHLRWTARLSARATQADLEALAGDQRVAELALVPRLAAIAKEAGVPLAALVPFPGVAMPTRSSAPSPTRSTGGTPTALPTGPPTTGVPTEPITGLPTFDPTVGPTAGPTVSNPPVVTNNPPTLGAIANSALDELAAMSLTLPGRDPDGDRVIYTVTGALPKGVSYSAGVIKGTVQVGAVSLTQTKTNLQSRGFDIRVAVRDSRGAVGPTRTFRITVRDTHIVMPSYLGFYGCHGDSGCSDPASRPNISKISTPAFACIADSSKPSGTIAAQSVPGGATHRWGAPVTWTYYEASCP